MAPLLLVDYSKCRADIGNLSFSLDSSCTSHWHDSGVSFAEEDDTGGDKMDENSFSTISTAASEASSSSASPLSIRVRQLSMRAAKPTTHSSHDESRVVSFRVRRRSSMGTTTTTATSADTGMSPSERFHSSLQDMTQMQTQTQQPRRHTASPAATISAPVDGDTSADAGRQYANWKRKQESLLSRSAHLATRPGSTHTGYSYSTSRQPQGRRGSMPHLQQQQGSTTPAPNRGSLSHYHSYHEGTTRRSVMNSAKHETSYSKAASSFHTPVSASRPARRYSLSPRPTCWSTTTSDTHLATRKKAARQGLGCQGSSSCHQRTSTTPNNNNKSEVSLGTMMSSRTSHSLFNSSRHSNSSFVTGSRIRRLDGNGSSRNINNSSSHQRNASSNTSGHKRSSILPTRQMLGYE